MTPLQLLIVLGIMCGLLFIQGYIRMKELMRGVVVATIIVAGIFYCLYKSNILW